MGGERLPGESRDDSSAVEGGITARGSGDYLKILSGTTQNVIGIVVAALAMFAAQVLIARTLGRAAFGVVTVLTQAAFVASFATRSGMDMAVLRDVAVEVGVGRWHVIRGTVARAVTIAGLVSLAIALVVAATSDAVSGLFPALEDYLSMNPQAGRWIVPAAALGLPFLALANVWLSATRGLKIMRYTLYVFWAGQPLVWIGLMVLGWQVSETAWMAVLAYTGSWVWAAGTAGFFWRRQSRVWDVAAPDPGWLKKLLRYAGPRAPAALFSQLLFWTDLFVLTRFASGRAVGTYSAALRAGQLVVLFLTSVNLMFGPYVADLHNRGQTERLDALFKTLTRWILAATLPLFLVIAVAPDEVLKIFGESYAGGETALLILIAGQFVNVATGSAGFILIMAGRTGWDLVVYAGSLVLDLALAFWLCSRYGMEGAATANSVTFAVSNLARLLRGRRFVRIQPYDGKYARLVAPAAAAAATMWLVHLVLDGRWLIDLLATAIIGAAAYALFYLAVGLTADERRGVANLLARARAR